MNKQKPLHTAQWFGLFWNTVQLYGAPIPMSTSKSWKWSREEQPGTSLEARRTKHRLIMFFKIVHGLVDIPSDAYLTPASTQTRSHHSLKFRQIPTSSDYYKHSFFPKTVCLWNSLPAAVAEAPDLVPFKRELSKISF